MPQKKRYASFCSPAASETRGLGARVELISRLSGGSETGGELEPAWERRAGSGAVVCSADDGPSSPRVPRRRRCARLRCPAPGARGNPRVPGPRPQGALSSSGGLLQMQLSALLLPELQTEILGSEERKVGLSSDSEKQHMEMKMKVK